MKKPSHRKELQRQAAKGDRAFQAAMIVALPVGAIALLLLIFRPHSDNNAGSHDYFSQTGLLYGIIYAAVFTFAGAFSLWRFAGSKGENDHTPDD